FSVFCFWFSFFFQAEDGIRDGHVTGVQTCALPIFRRGAVRDQALAAWSLVHGLTTLLIDQRLSFLGVSTGDAERHARLAGMTLFAGLSAKTASHRSRG